MLNFRSNEFGEDLFEFRFEQEKYADESGPTGLRVCER